MSRFSGPQRRGADREQHDDRRLAGQARDDVTTATRRQPKPTELERDCS